MFSHGLALLARSSSPSRSFNNYEDSPSNNNIPRIY